MSDEAKEILKVIASILGMVSLVLVVGLAGCPRYNVYEQRLQGEAALAKSVAERQVQIQDSESKKIAATFLAQAEVERAKGVAAANLIIGDSLKNNESYLRWLWIHNLENAEKNGQVIYIPTEAGLPIMEAGKRR